MSTQAAKGGLLDALENQFGDDFRGFAGRCDHSTIGGSRAGYGRLFTCDAGATERGTRRFDGVSSSVIP